MGWFRNWLDEVTSGGRPVVLVGFSGSAAFAGGLPFADTARSIELLATEVLPAVRREIGGRLKTTATAPVSGRP